MERFRYAFEDSDIDAARMDCRGFVGIVRHNPLAPLFGATSAGLGRSAGLTSRTSHWHGDAAVALTASTHDRILLVTGGGRHGLGLAKARRVVEGMAAPASLTEMTGGLGCAFVLFDFAAGRIVLGRDRMGITPLYLACRSKSIAFATELGALAMLSDGAPTLDAEVIAMYFDHGFNGDERTPLQGVEKVRPGAVIEIDRDLTITRMAIPDLLHEDPDASSQAARAPHFDALFDAAVCDQIEPERPTSLMLSGGLDSALVCASLSRVVARPVHTCTVAYDFTRKREEVAEARRIASLFGTRHTEVRLTQDDLWHHIPWTVWHTDELMDDHAALATSLAARRFAPDTMVMTGEGADDVFAGDGQYRRHWIQRWLANIAAPGTGGWRTRELRKPAWPGRIFGARLKQASQGDRSDMQAAWNAAPQWASWLRRAQACELASIFPNTLAIKVGRSFEGAAHGVRMPFLDPALVRFGLGLDDRAKVRGSVGKFFLREWASTRLPRDYVFRPKRGFYTPISALFTADRLDRLEPVLCSSQFAAQWMNATQITHLFSDHRATGRHGKTIWRLAQAAIWYSIFVLRPKLRPSIKEDPLAWIL